MACFLVPAAEAVISTIAAKAVKSHESENESNTGIKLSKKLNWLNGFLWGGSGLLAFEHLWHGEITPYFPFLTSASNPADTAEMLHEMATSGVAMAVLVTAFWATVCVAADLLNKRDKSHMEEEKA